MSRTRAGFERQARRLVDLAEGSQKAAARARGTLLRRLPVEARRDMQEEFNLPAARIRAGLSVRRASIAVELTGSKRGIGLINFGGKWGGVRTPGATAQRRRRAGRETYDGAFIAAGRGGNRQIFERTSRARLPLRTLYGPSVADMLKNAPRRERLAAFARATLGAEMARLLGRNA